ncbi:hypothetical protein JRQ81_012297 [Phrynocephalus forsythii]|uniref:Uncharacterized protein n=1 Tax=Phrynocephalus forsythii TaxID=171643 RepID=A0A9Q0X5P3_9SAUR|nr:hypothetical protein JRQ81_012297 [Phrynocephalus forsythii]
MAAASDTSIRGLCEEATCCICQEYFKDPVITECGHNFCRDCLAQCWEGSEEEEVSCPQCRENVRRNLIIPNRQLANVVELTKKLHLQEENSAEGKRGACEKHQEPLKLFCKKDEAPICVVCKWSEEHQDHQVVHLEEAAQDYKHLIWRLELLQEETTNVLIDKAETETESQELLKQVKAGMEKTKEQFGELQPFLMKQEKLLLAQLEEVEKEIARKTEEHLARLSAELSSLEGLIQVIEQKLQLPPVELLQDIRTILQSLEKEKPPKSVAFPPELKRKFRDVCDRNSVFAETMKQFRGKMEECSGSQAVIPSQTQTLVPLLESREGDPAPLRLLGNRAQSKGEGLANVTLDPDTANKQLILSEDCKRVSNRGKDQNVPSNSKRFRTCPFLLGREGFTAGRHHWNVSVGSEGNWVVGVARKSVWRKGSVDLSIKEGIWAVEKQNHIYIASNIPPHYFVPPCKKLERIRVSLNYEGGQVAFHDDDTKSHLYTFAGVSFAGETVLPFFGVWQKSSLIISP